MNKGTLIGFISSDINSKEMKLKAGGTVKRVSFNIACQRKGKNAGADFPRLIAFGRTAEVIEQYLTKGRGAIIQFHVQTSSYTDKTGQKVYSTDLVCDEVEFVPVKRNDDTKTESNYSTPDDFPPSAPEEYTSNFNNIDDDIGELPFR